MRHIDFEKEVLNDLLFIKNITPTFKYPIILKVISSAAYPSSDEFQVKYTPGIFYASREWELDEPRWYREDKHPDAGAINNYYFNDVLIPGLEENPNFWDFMYSHFLEVLIGKEDLKIIEIPERNSIESQINRLVDGDTSFLELREDGDKFIYDAKIKDNKYAFIVKELRDIEKGRIGLFNQRVSLIEYHLKKNYLDSILERRENMVSFTLKNQLVLF